MDQLDIAADPREVIRRLIHSRTFLSLLVAEFQSVVGDQLARVALSVLVFSWTDSATLTAVTYAATFVPALAGGLFLTRIGDRFPRLLVMITCDLVRAALFALMALPGLDIGAVMSLLIVAVAIGPIFGATQISYLSTVLQDRLFGSATGIRLASDQSSQVFGFAVGGIVVAALGPRPALVLNAGTFVVSAVLVAFAGRGSQPTGLEREQQPDVGLRVVAAAAPGDGRAAVAPDQTGLRATSAWFTSSRTRLALLGLSALAGLFVVPEGLAVPYAQDIGALRFGTGFLLAAIPLGSAVGAAVLVRFVPDSWRTRAAALSAALCGVPLIAMSWGPPWPVSAAMWFLSGAFSAYQVVVITSVAGIAPASRRASIMGFGGAIVVGAQGAGLLLFGVVAQWADPGEAIALAGLTGSLLAVVLIGYGLPDWPRRKPVRSRIESVG